MIFFLVNNDYQLVDVHRHIAQLRLHNLAATLIEVPHTLNATEREKGFASVVRLPSPMLGRRWFKAWFEYLRMPHRVARELKPTPSDVLFFYTEFELLNHIVALRFKSSGARVYLVEDGGFATYVPMSTAGGEPMTWKERLIATMTRLLPGLGRTQFHKVNGQVFPWLPDTVIDALCVYRSIVPVRRLRLELLLPEARTPQPTIGGRVIFLNQPMYDHYQSDEQYIDALDEIMRRLCRGFGEVLFKFHPREDAAWADRIRGLLQERHPTVRILDEQQPFEKLAATYRPEVLASFFSAALLNMDTTGIEPLYLYHLFPQLKAQPVFLQVTQLLTHWGYHFVSSFDEARAGYKSGLAFDASEARVSLADVVMQHQ